ncbi:MAG: hypothetical protein AB1941_08375 [Gemmatimonadota bacterium]
MLVKNRGALFGRLALAVLLSAGAAACDSSTEPEDHDEAVGVVVLDRATQQTLASVAANRQVTGGLTVKAGAERAIEVWFVAEDGDRFMPDGDDHTLDIRVADPTRARIESHGDHADFVGVQAGTTTVVFAIEHGGHDDYRSEPIPVTVTP